MVEEEDIAAVADVLRSDWLTTGPLVERFEQAFASYVGAAHAVAASSGNAGMPHALSSPSGAGSSRSRDIMN